jgi:hypothetical protein
MGNARLFLEHAPKMSHDPDRCLYSRGERLYIETRTFPFDALMGILEGGMAINIRGGNSYFS